MKDLGFKIKNFGWRWANEVNERKENMEEKYTFEMMWEDLNNGYQIFYTYVRNRYLLFKTDEL